MANLGLNDWFWDARGQNFTLTCSARIAMETCCTVVKDIQSFKLKTETELFHFVLPRQGFFLNVRETEEVGERKLIAENSL